MYAYMSQDRIAPSSYLSRMFTIVQHDKMRFLIMDCPTDSNLAMVMKMLIREGVTDVVRVCEPSYAKELLVDQGIFVHDMAFKDGGCPPSSVLQAFLSLVQLRFFSPATTGCGTIAVHCVAGLGRAPVMIAIALIEGGMSPLDAIEFVRSRRRGAFNTLQVKYLDAYKPVSNKFSTQNDPLVKRTSSPRLLASLQQYKRNHHRPRSSTTNLHYHQSLDNINYNTNSTNTSNTTPSPKETSSSSSDRASSPISILSLPPTAVNWTHKFSKLLSPFSTAFKHHRAPSSNLSKVPADVVAAHP